MFTKYVQTQIYSITNTLKKNKLLDKYKTILLYPYRGIRIKVRVSRSWRNDNNLSSKKIKK